MARVHLQRSHAEYTNGTRELTIDGDTVGQLIDGLDAVYPGLGVALRRGSSVAIDSAIVANGEFERVDDDTDVHFISKVVGG